MSQQHTPEPWEVVTDCPGECCWHIQPVEHPNRGPWDRINSPEMSEADARRIVACVNACADMSTEYLEQCGKMRRNEAGESIVELIQQRDDERKKHEACVTINERLLSDNRILTEQRDELMAALEAAKSDLLQRAEMDSEDGGAILNISDGVLQKMNAAIAKAKP